MPSKPVYHTVGASKPSPGPHGKSSGSRTGGKAPASAFAPRSSGSRGAVVVNVPPAHRSSRVRRIVAIEGLGQTSVGSTAVVGWAAVALLAAGIFWFATSPRPTANRRRVRRNLFGGSKRYKITTTSGRTIKSVDDYGHAHAERISLDRGEPVELVDTQTGKRETIGGHALEPNARGRRRVSSGQDLVTYRWEIQKMVDGKWRFWGAAPTKAEAENEMYARGEGHMRVVKMANPVKQLERVRRFRPNRLSASSRARMPRKSFVFPERRAWPIDTPERAYAAIQMIRMGRVSTSGDYRKITRAIRHRYPRVWAIYGKKLAWSRVKRAKGRRASHPRRRRRSSRMAANGKRRRVVRNASLHERVAQALGWTPDQARGFSLAALRDLVRPVDPRLAEEISDQIRGGPHVFGRPLRLPPGALTGGIKRNMGWDMENVQQMMQQLQRVLSGQVGSDAEEVQIVDDAHEFASELKRRSGKLAKGSSPQRRLREWARAIEALAQQAESSWRPA